MRDSLFEYIRAVAASNVKKQFAELLFAELLDTAPSITPQEQLAVHEALGTLSEGDYRIVLLRFWEGLSIHEIAKLRHMSWDAADHALSRILDELRRLVVRDIRLVRWAKTKPINRNHKPVQEEHLMSANTLKTYQTVRPILKTYPSESPRPQKHREHSPRFDIFKGTRDKTGKVVRVKSVGCAFLHPTTMNYTVFLRTFINDVFYLLKETINPAFGDYAILTRIPAVNPTESSSGTTSVRVVFSWDPTRDFST